MALPIHPVTPPREIAGRSNGKLPVSVLSFTPGLAGGSAVLLVEPAARAWRALTAAALDDGHTLKIGWPNSAYRPYADQERIFRARYTPHILPPGRRWHGKFWRKRPGVAAAAVPGTSNHGWGLAVDVGAELDGDPGTESLDAATLTWLKIHAHRFGWSWELQSEPWHLRMWAGDNIPAAVLAYERTTTEPDEGLTDMETLIDTTTGEHWVAANGKADKLSKPDEWMASWVGPTRQSANMRHVIANLYEVVG